MVLKPKVENVTLCPSSSSARCVAHLLRVAGLRRRVEPALLRLHLHVLRRRRVDRHGTTRARARAALRRSRETVTHIELPLVLRLCDLTPSQAHQRPTERAGFHNIN